MGLVKVTREKIWTELNKIKLIRQTKDDLGTDYFHGRRQEDSGIFTISYFTIYILLYTSITISKPFYRRYSEYDFLPVFPIRQDFSSRYLRVRTSSLKMKISYSLQFFTKYTPPISPHPDLSDALDTPTLKGRDRRSSLSFDRRFGTGLNTDKYRLWVTLLHHLYRTVYF